MNERGNKRDIVKILSKHRTETSKIVKRMFQILVFSSILRIYHIYYLNSKTKFNMFK